MDAKRKKRLQAAVDVLMEYKTGQINLENAVNQFCGLSELKRENAEEYIKSMTRNNVIPIGLSRRYKNNK